MRQDLAQPLDSSNTEAHSHSENEGQSNDGSKTSETKSKNNVREQFSCSHCPLVFSRRDAFDRHEFIHTGIKKFPCPKTGCTKHYTNRAYLQRHIRTAHTERTAEPKAKLKCSDENCQRMFANKFGLDRHYRNVHLGMKPKFICHFCNKQFDRKAQLKTHMFEHTNKYPYKCEICNAGFLNQKMARHHSVLHRSYKCIQCSEHFTKWSALQLHRQSHLPPHTCDECHATFANKTNLKIHMAKHQAANVYQCPENDCANFYSDLNALRFHIRRVHMMQKYECYYCSRQLSTKQKLKFHMKKLHLDGIVKKYTPPKRKSKTKTKCGRHFSTTKLSSAAKLTGIESSAEIEQLIQNGAGQKVQLTADNFLEIEIQENVDESCKQNEIK